MNKRILYLLLVVLLSSCNNNTPKGIANVFMTNINKGNFAEAKNYCTDATRATIDMMIGMSAQTGQPVTYGKYEILREVIVQDHATVFYKAEGRAREETLDMIKIDEKWKVNLKMGK